ncbi:MAG TPA: hypothetical protein VH413_07085 [Verrucomicrobiae bacterium]|nr:hypothetical protein [Verrucomicrobiae bacterium]
MAERILQPGDDGVLTARGIKQTQSKHRPGEMLTVRHNQINAAGNIDIGGKINLMLSIGGRAAVGSELNVFGRRNPLSGNQMVEAGGKLGE